MGRFAVTAALALATVTGAELPVKEVILYKHGVGYFERSGELRAGEAARLDFKASEMNDVLKSLTLQGAKVSGLRYDSSEPLERKLSEFPFKIDAAAPALSFFLNQLKGSRVELKFGGETVSGVIMSARQIVATDKQNEREQVVLLLDNGDLRTLDLSAATAVHFTDPALQSKLREYLRVVEQARSKEKRSVYIDSIDTGARQIAASYLVPTTVWKSSYRLLFPSAGEPTLEGWAIVDNTTGEDWDKVQLALVSGRPVSFVSNLYEPKYRARPVAELPEDRAAAPVVYEGAVADAVRADRRAVAGGLAGGVPGGIVGGIVGNVPSAAPPPSPYQIKSPPMMAESSSVSQTAQGRDVGELFEYRFSTPVTVKKSESAMLPFLQQKIGARKLLIYSEAYGQHPMNAAELTNSSGKTLDGGPITVFDAGSYAGEALIETVKSGDKRLISYGVDLGTRITTAYDSKVANVREIHANRGLLTTRYAQQELVTYNINNVDAKAKTLIVERPVRRGYQVLDQKPTEKTPSAMRFQVSVPANGSQTFAVTEEREYDSTVQLISLTPDVLLDYVANKKLSDTARRQLEAIAQKKEQIAGNDNEMHSLEQQITDFNRDQDRIRQNIQSLNNVSGQQEQVQKYARILADQEAKLAQLRDQLTAATKRKTALQAELNSMIGKVEF